MDPKNNEEVEQIRYCKKCGCELVSTSKRKLCENCRRNRNAKIREYGAGVAAFLVGVVMFGPKLLSQLNEKTSRYADSDEDDNENSDRDESDTL